jgi:hypothetical protein
MMRRSIIGIAAVLLMVLAGVLVAVGTGLGGTAIRREPFSSQRESGDGIMVKWSGFTAGHQPGEQATVETTFANNADQVWPVRFCLQLLDRQEDRVEIMRMDEREFSLAPGVAQSGQISFEIPAGLEPGAYGLSLVVQRPGGPMVDAVAIRVGTTDAVFGPVSSEETNAALLACLPAADVGTKVPGPNG